MPPLHLVLGERDFIDVPSCLRVQRLLNAPQALAENPAAAASRAAAPVGRAGQSEGSSDPGWVLVEGSKHGEERKPAAALRPESKQQRDNRAGDEAATGALPGTAPTASAAGPRVTGVAEKGGRLRPRCQVSTIKGAGHHMHVTHHADFARQVILHAASQPTTSQL